MTGFVSLVGAGPGDAELLTLKAARRLAAADLVLYDALVSRDALGLAPRAHCFLVGKRAGRPSVRQEAINRLMIRTASRGKRVVRLKCGDPFVLGRGGEEALALAAAGVPFEVIPGLTTAVAAPGLAGIPVTHRGLASGFVVVSGHARAAYRPIVEALAPNSLTLVVLMGLASRGTPRARTWLGALDALAHAPVGIERADTGTIVIGEVVAVGAALAGALFPHRATPAASQAV